MLIRRNSITAAAISSGRNFMWAAQPQPIRQAPMRSGLRSRWSASLATGRRKQHTLDSRENFIRILMNTRLFYVGHSMSEPKLNESASESQTGIVPDRDSPAMTRPGSQVAARREELG